MTKSSSSKDNIDNIDDYDNNDLIELLNVSVGNNEETRNYSTGDHIKQFMMICLKYGLLVGFLTLNFIGLSVALNCNVNEELGKRIMSAIFAFFFGFVYLLVNYYTFRILIKGQVCPMNKEKLFPFD